MAMRKTMLSVLLTSCAMETFAIPIISQAASPIVLSVRVAPPPYQNDVVPLAGRGYSWVPGYWSWQRNRHVWIAGNWGYGGRGNGWHNGLARGDRDGDRIPNHRDRHPNNFYRY